MRNITFAIYKGIEYSAGIKKDGRIVLRSEDDASKKEGFVEKEIGNNRIYIKYVQKDEIEEIYDKKTYAVYEGYKFIVVDETEKQILILTMNGDYQEWIRLGMECIDKGMYQKWINKNEAEIEVLKEKYNKCIVIMGRTIKNGRFCIYNGNEFKVNRDSDGNTIILTKNDKIMDSTFIDKNGSGVYSKKVSLEEIEELYRYATYAVINNYKVNVEKENQEYYFVGTADCKVAGALGLQRGEFLGNSVDSFESRTLAPHSEGAEIHYYQLVEDYEFTTGKAAP